METRTQLLAGQTALVTGGTAGIGLAAARALAAMGAQVTVVGRDAGRGAAAQAEGLAFLQADLSSLASVRGLAKEVLGRAGRLDILVNNAGAMFPDRRTTADGYEATLALNHLGPFLLTHLLMEALEAAPAARIVNVNGMMHHLGRIDLDDLQQERSYRGLRAYASAKLANLMFTYGLAKRLGAGRITVNAAHPGVVKTDHTSGLTGFHRFLSWLQTPIMISPEKGAETPVFLASGDAVRGVTGQYFIKRRAVASSRASRNEILSDQLWEETARLVRV